MLGLSRSDFLYSLPLVLGVAFIPVFALAMWHALAAIGTPVRSRWLLVALVTSVLFSMSMLDFHILYVHSNLGTAIYLSTFVVLFWIAEVRGDPSYLPLAFISLAAFALHRTETPPVALLFLALMVPRASCPVVPSPSGWPRSPPW